MQGGRGLCERGHEVWKEADVRAQMLHYTRTRGTLAVNGMGERLESGKGKGAIGASVSRMNV